MPKQHANIPIFIPHLGCPNDCVFCNQRTISGHNGFDVSGVREEIRRALGTIGERDAEIAFFGGSFTGIDRTLMVYLLELAEEFVRAGRVSGIRLSTRPDYIDEEILDILSHYTVNAIELGIQSTSDTVLTSSKRGHTAEASERACRLIRQRGFSLVGQMMIGLPSSEPEDEIRTAKDICDWGCGAARVYPTVVFYGTELCEMSKRELYTPLDTESAIQRTASVLDVFDRRSVDVIRVGLCASKNLSSDEQVYGGANHAAIGELAMGELYFRRICELAEREDELKNVMLYVPRGAVSKVIGQKKRNILRLKEKYGVNVVKILEKNEIFGYNIKLEKC